MGPVPVIVSGFYHQNSRDCPKPPALPMAPSRWRQESALAWRRGWEHPRGCPPARITAGAINAEGSSVGTDARLKGGFAYMYEPAWHALPDAVSGVCRAKCVFSIRGPLPSAASVILTSLFGRFSGIMVYPTSPGCARGDCACGFPGRP